MAKSGIQMIEEMLGKLSVLDRRMEVLEQTMKELLAARNAQPQPVQVQQKKSLPEGLRLNSKPASEASSQSTPRMAAADEKPEFQPIVKAASNARAIGRVQQGGKAVPGVSVTLFDSRNHPVKETKTNRAGDWMAFLPPGRYAAACMLEGKINENVMFEVKPGDKIVRVGRPNE